MKKTAGIMLILALCCAVTFSSCAYKNYPEQ